MNDEELREEYTSRFTTATDHEFHIPLSDNWIAHLTPGTPIDDERKWYYSATFMGVEMEFGVMAGPVESTPDEAAHVVLHLLASTTSYLGVSLN